MATKFTAAMARVVSWVVSNWAVLAAAAPNVASFTVPQDGFIIGGNIIVDAKSAITVLLAMVEVNGANVLTGTGADLNAATVRTPVALAFLASAVDVNGWVPVKAGDVITLDIDSLTGTSATGIQLQLDFIPK